ncbi:filamentation protein-like protein [Phyllosticta citribraziliensis]|uniref:Filamentation protein-like protein n=1 Tax=Phyllosticta citribraziliensis TaxID=989973 RepID=A0ABR1LGJ0_9PEZI
MPDNAKANGYIAQLDDARCNARWGDVPELARKIEKHAPHRTCLYTTARAEAHVAAHYKAQYAPPPSPTAATPPPPDLRTLIDPLAAALGAETTHKQDVFAAAVCLAWIHSVLDEPDLTLSRLPANFEDKIAELNTGDESLTGWTQVCIIKGAYLKGSAQKTLGSTAEATQSYKSVFRFLSQNILSSASPQLKCWSEALLAHLCIYQDISRPGARVEEFNQSIQTFRLWSRVTDNGKALFGGLDGSDPPNMRRAVWKAYYGSLSVILRRRTLYTGSSDPADPLMRDDAEHASEEQYISAKLHQRSELRLAESVYEALLLKEKLFPKASENNEEIDSWAESVMRNWRVLCGPTWTDDELGEGGKAGVGKCVLDILYRAATKSYHSTSILRHLFIVHASLAEFDLAFKAFDSYVEIISRGKDRAEKTGEEDPGLDDNDIVLRTASEAIRILCRFGSFNEAEKAKKVGEQIEKWLKQHTPASRPGTAKTNSSETEKERPTESSISPRVLAIAHRAIGISRAHWARLTYEATARSTLQTQAALALRRALSPEYEDPNNLETQYALGLLLSEMRDINGAIKIVKRALSTYSQPDGLRTPDGVLSEDAGDEEAEYIRERKLIPLWHLLALLLTAKSDFATAERTAEAAFEQFNDPSVLFGAPDAFRSEHLNDSGAGISGHQAKANLGLVDRMEAFEKEGVLQVKFTQLKLLEVLEGTTAAVDASMELLALYKRLFGDPSSGQQKVALGSSEALPHNHSTTRVSMFGRRKNTNQGGRSTSVPPASRRSSSRPSTIVTDGTAAPAIQVTDDTGKANGHRSFPSLIKPLERHSFLSKSGSIKLKKRSSSVAKTADSAENSEKTDSVADGATRRGSAPSGKLRGSVSSSNDQPLRSVAHNLSHQNEPPPAGHEDQPPQQDTRLPAPFPRPYFSFIEPQFPKLQERRHTTSLLIDVWLFIAGLYTRAALFEDAKGAVDEAFKLADNLEQEVSQESSSARFFSERGWGGGKSVEELWAEIHACRGQIAHAEGEPHEASSHFEKALSHHPDDSVSVIGLSNILLDIYTQKIPPEPVEFAGASRIQPSTNETRRPSGQSPSPEELNRLAARDRAYGLLSTLTKLGSGWDDSEAWFALARAYEEGGQIEKAKEVLWWCVELEDTKALRPWNCVGVGGFVL